MRYPNAALVLWLLMVGTSSAEAISASKMCQKAHAENRLNGSSVRQCVCMAGVSQKYLSPELYALWTEAMYLGESRMAEMEDLKQPQATTVRQLKKVLDRSRQNCGTSW